MKNINFIEDYLKSFCSNLEKKRFLVCLSGGMDSVYLYHQIYSLSMKNDFKIGIAHVNYNTSENSKKASNLCKEIATENHHHFYIKSVTLDPYNFEHNARELRYDFFNSIKKVEKYDFILTAHHKDDLIETLYMQNSSPGDYSCIPLNQENNGLLRPLIEISKKDIVDDIKKQNWSYFEDPSNQDTKYKRNQVRHEILPNLDNKEERIESMLSCYREKLNKYNKFIEDFNSNKDTMVLKNKNQIQINRNYLKTVDVYGFKLIIQGLLNDAYRFIPIKSQKFWKENYDILLSNKVGAKKEINSNITLYFEEDCIILLNKNLKSNCVRLIDQVKWMDYSFKVENYEKGMSLNLHDKSVFLCPKDIFDEGLYIRKKRDGDRYSFKEDMNKNISDLFNEHKIPISKREMMPVIILNDEIQWIPGVAHASNNHLTSNDLLKVSAVVR